MSQVYLGRGGDRRALRLGKLLGEGASGKVHALPAMPGSAAKLYHGPAESRAHEAKIDAMLASPPDLPPAEHDGVAYPQIAWPEAKLYDASGRFVGFVMPEIDFGRSTSLVNLLQKNSRRIEKLSEYYGYRLLVARNLASVFAELHRAGHHMIDMKPANLRFYPAVCWMAVVDTDGFSIAANAAGSRGRIAAAQLSDEYIAPESWRREPAELGVEQDLFALAAIIFQLLDNGVHPFAGAAGSTDQATDLQTRILEGLYPYALRTPEGVAPSLASVHRMFPRSTRTLFDRAFLPGGERPSAEGWRDHLDQLMGKLSPCETKPGEHAHFGVGCGLCAYDARVEGARAAAARAVPVRNRAPVAVRRPQPPVGRARPVAVRPGPVRGAVRTAPPRKARRGWVAVMVLLLIVSGLATRDLWRPMLPSAEASDIAAIDRRPELPADGTLASFAEAREYLIIPPSGDLSVALRRGAGEGFGVNARMELHDRVIGMGTRAAADGGQWVWVTRESDGMAGFVPVATLAEIGGLALGSDWMTVSDRMVDQRHRELLARAEGLDQVFLIDGRILWERQRRRCDAEPDRERCRSRVNAQWLSEFENWEASASRAGRAVPSAIRPNG